MMELIQECSAQEPELPSANVLGVRVDAVDMTSTLKRLHQCLQEGTRGYVVAMGVHGVMEGMKNDDVARAHREALLVVPDGTPMAWVGWAQGYKSMQVVPGPDLMLRVFADERFAGCRHFLYGGKPGVAEELAAVLSSRFPASEICGVYTPPFRELTESEEATMARYVNASSPDIVWVGISTPRQELWMRRMLPKLNARLMFGVGAAFDFHTNRIRNCPAWVKRAGLHWLHRLAQDPKRLWRRNVQNLPFLWHIALQFCGLGGADRPAVSKANGRCDRTVAQIR